jgi:hypothetical protein
MGCEILEMRLSLIWSETVLDLLEKNVPADAPLKALGRRATYEQLFEQVLKSQSNSTPIHALMGATKPVPLLGPPWPKPEGQLYWQRYLESSTLGNLSGSVAWRGLVPLRSKFPIVVVPGQWLATSPAPVKIKVLREAFFYPHGCAFVLTLIAEVQRTQPPGPGLDLFDAVDLAFKLRRDKFKVTWDGNAGLYAGVQWADAPGEITLDQLAGKALPVICATAFGPAAAANSAQAMDPFTIFTVARGRGVDLTVSPSDDVRRALEAVTRWSQSWRFDNPPPDLKDRKIDIKTSPPSHLLYGRAKARAVWFPERFTHADNPPSVACYHRNLTFTSLHVESLCGLAAATAERVRNNQLDSEGLRDCARQAVGSLGRLYGGGGAHKKSYRSMSPRVQIEQNNFVDDVNLVRKELGVGSDLV